MSRQSDITLAQVASKMHEAKMRCERETQLALAATSPTEYDQHIKLATKAINDRRTWTITYHALLRPDTEMGF